MKHLRSVALALISFVLTISCTTTPPLAGGEGSGTARITSFAVTGLENPHIRVDSIVCGIVEERESGRLTAILPGGTSTRVSLDFTVRGGSLWSDGLKLSKNDVIDLASVKSLLAVDGKGRSRLYSLEIREARIPTVYITTENAAPILTKTDWVKGTVAISGGSTPWASALKQVPMKVRGRGNSTWDMPKKPYRFTLDESASIFGLPKAKKWVLLANYADKSLVRNFVAYSVAAEFTSLKFTPHQYPVQLYLNGEYLGVYGLGEQVETGSGRLVLDKPDSSPDTSFFVEVNMRIDSAVQGGVEGRDFFKTPSGIKIEYKTPDSDEISGPQKAAISAFMAEAEKAVLSGKGFDAYLDVATFVDWLIVEELFKNQDSIFLSSVYLSRQRAGKLAIGPIWDFDLSAGNSDYGAIGAVPVNSPEGWFPLYSEWYSGLYADREFRKRVVARWFEMRAALEKKTFSALDEFAALTGEVQADNFSKWKIMGIYVWPNPPELVAADTHDKQVEALRAWLKARFAWLDDAMMKLENPE